MLYRRTFIKQLGIGAIGIGVLSNLEGCSSAHTSSLTENTALPRSTPEQQGVSSQSIIRFLDAIKTSGQEFHSLMIVRNGHV
ncbi:MAG: serine hydrolase, partial [Marivirga sp.]|nr:serine hydrolase [Marivirga sp.]